MSDLTSGCGQEIDDPLDGGVGAMIGGLEPAVGAVVRVRAMVEAAVGERTAETFVEEQKEQRYLNP